LNEALEIAGRSRLRPVLMTSLTAILGMLPMAIGIGAGSRIWAPMGITIIGGMIFSTIVTLILVPVLYAIFARHGDRNKQEKVRKQFIFMKDKDDEFKK